MTESDRPVAPGKGTKKVRVSRMDFVQVNNLEEAAESVIRLAHASRQATSKYHVHFLNAYSISLAPPSTPLLSSLQDPLSVNFPDGKPLSWVSSIRGDFPSLSQVRGPAAFREILSKGVESGVRHFFLGSTPETLERLQGEVRRAFPGIKVVGSYSPPFRALSEEELTKQDSAIAEAAPDIVWVGLGTPKQDYEAVRLASSISALPIAVGAAFGFMAGTVKEAPSIFTKLGLEWLFRFLTEPRRLWRRYLVGNVRFAIAVIREDLAGTMDRSRDKLKQDPVVGFCLWLKLRARRARRSHSAILRLLGLILSSIYRVISLYLLGMDIPTSVEMGRVKIFHPNGLTINDRAIIGNGVVLRGNTTIGERSGDEAAPVIENLVELGPNVVVIGPVTIGESSVVGAGSVVVSDVPRRSTVVGNPARVVVRSEREV